MQVTLIIEGYFKIASNLWSNYNSSMNTELDPLNEMSFKRSSCPIACSLDIIGDKWTLLVVRDLFFGKTKFKELQASAENIPTNLLTSRLKLLEQAGMVAKTPYQERPVRYEYQLTDIGKSLEPVVKTIVKWGEAQFDRTSRDGSF